MDHWLYALQPSTQGSYFTCKYYAKVTFKHSAVSLGQKLGEIYVPIQIYFISKSFADMPKFVPPPEEDEFVQPQNHGLGNERKESEKLPPNPYLTN